MIAFREDPAVPARQDRELDHHPAAVQLAWNDTVANVSLERDTGNDVAAEPERTRGDAVRAVGTDERVDVDDRPVDVELSVGLHVDTHAVAKLHARFLRTLDEVVIEPAPLRHQAKRRPPFTFERPAVAQPAREVCYDVLDDRVDGERQFLDSAQRQPAAARLVAGETRFVY